jgi:hypothetical protein
VTGYDVGCDGSLNRSQHAHDRWVARFIEVCTTTGVSGSFLRSLFTGRAHGEPRPPGQRIGFRKEIGGRLGGRTELGAGSFVPEGDASESASSSQGERNPDAETPEIGRSFRGRLFQSNRARRVDRRAREDACIGTGRSKRMELTTPSFSRESYPREWVDQTRGDATTVR